MSDLIKSLTSEIGSSLIDAAKDKLKRQWSEQASDVVVALIQLREIHKDRIENAQKEFKLIEDRLAAIEGGAFKVERWADNQVHVVYDDENLNEDPETLMVKAVLGDPKAHRRFR